MRTSLLTQSNALIAKLQNWGSHKQVKADCRSSSRERRNCGGRRESERLKTPPSMKLKLCPQSQRKGNSGVSCIEQATTAKWIGHQMLLDQFLLARCPMGHWVEKVLMMSHTGEGLKRPVCCVVLLSRPVWPKFDNHKINWVNHYINEKDRMVFQTHA